MKFWIILVFVFLIPILCGISDNLLLYTPDLFSKAENYQFLKTISKEQQKNGFLLGIVCIPMLYFCFTFLAAQVDLASQKALLSLRKIVLALIFTGCLVHTMYYFLIEWLLLFPSTFYFAKMLEILFLCFFLYFAYKLYQISSNKQHIDLYKIRFFNPFGYLILCVIFALIFPLMGIRFLISAFNLSFLWVLIGYFFLVLIPQKIRKIPNIT
jgi:hypothetical protein